MEKLRHVCATKKGAVLLSILMNKHAFKPVIASVSEAIQWLKVAGLPRRKRLAMAAWCKFIHFYA
jgi:type III secretory pathway lipoprotein EscJ